MDFRDEALRVETTECDGSYLLLARNGTGVRLEASAAATLDHIIGGVGG